MNQKEGPAPIHPSSFILRSCVTLPEKPAIQCPVSAIAMFEGKRILTVDDSTTIRNYLRNLLTQQHATVDGAGAGEEGLQKAKEARYDVILLDLLLPDIDGIQVLTQIRERDDDVSVVMLTGEGGIRSATTALQKGADGYIEKQDVVSGDPAAFFYALRQAMERRANIVEQKRLQAEIAEKVHQLQLSENKALEASAAKSTFLANMSHELRTPLNAILGFIQLLQRDATLGPTQREYVEIVARSGEHLLALINDVLSLSKIEAGQLTLNEETYDLRRLLQSIEEMFRMRAQTKELEFLFEPDSGVPRYVRGDESKLRQVIINLLGNAFKFTERGGVAVRTKWENGTFTFEVEDTGPGIDETELAHIFEAFVQSRTGLTAKEGTGLGLAISRNIVRFMGGDIFVKSEVGRGSMFVFALPLPSVADSEAPRTKGKPIGLEADQEQFRIVVADDKWESRTALGKLLTTVGFEVLEAVNGQEAVDLHDSWNPHLIWMDLRMPLMDGFEATKRIREAKGAQGPESGLRCVIVALTASVFEQDRHAILAAGCDDFVAKPFHERTIFEVIQRHLGVRYVYEAGHPSQADDADLVAVNPESLAAISPDLVDRLGEAMTLGDMAAVVAVIDEIHEEDEGLANGIRRLVSAYRFDDVSTLLRQAPRRD
jgi:signal transduction histidine kinase